MYIYGTIDDAPGKKKAKGGSQEAKRDDEEREMKRREAAMEKERVDRIVCDARLPAKSYDLPFLRVTSSSPGSLGPSLEECTRSVASVASLLFSEGDITNLILIRSNRSPVHYQVFLKGIVYIVLCVDKESE